MTKVYLAGGWFTDKQAKDLKNTRKMLEKNVTVGDIYSAQDHPSKEVFGTTAWKKETFMADCKAMREADTIVATLTDGELDTGTIWELGFAYALNKVVILVTDQEMLNLMLAESFNGIIINTESGIMKDVMHMEDDIEQTSSKVTHEIDLTKIDFNSVTAGTGLNGWIETVE